MKDEYQIERVLSVSIENFRGFAERKTINTDAEIVLIVGSNGFGKTSLLDALCLLLNGMVYHDRGDLRHGQETKSTLIIKTPSGEEKLEVEGNKRSINSYEPTKLPWWPNIGEPEIITRSSFFYQDLVDKIFTAENGATLREFFVPPLPFIGSIEAKLIDLNNRWRDETQLYKQRAGLMTEDDIKAKQKEQINEFVNVWNSLSTSKTVTNLGLTQDYQAGFLVINSNNARNTWRGELRNFVNDLNRVLGDATGMSELGTKANLVEIINRLSWLLLRLKNNVFTENIKQNTKINDIDKFMIGLSSDLDKYFLVSVAEKGAAEQELVRIKQELANVSVQAEQIGNLRGQFHALNSGDVDLVDILHSLEKNGATWLTAPQSQIQLPLPVGLTDWLKEIVRTMVPEWSGQLLEWEKKVTEEHGNILRQRELLSGQLNRHEQLIAISDRILSFEQQNGDLQDHLTKEYQQQGKISLGDLKKQLLDRISTSQAKSESDPSTEKSLAILLETVHVWGELEKKINQHFEAEKLSQAGDYSQGITNILNRESNSTKKQLPLWKAGYDILPSEKAAIEKRMNGVLAHFRMVEGLESFKISFGKDRKNGDIQINSEDGRSLHNLSTGQKAQVALSLMLALNYSMSDYLKHKIIAIDDITTPFDMSQMARFAILLRQIAYAEKGRESGRQVFVVSHHEDMSDRLIEFLVPPEGCKLRVIKFTDWVKVKGPEIEQFEVRHALSADKRDQLKVSLERLQNA